MALPEHVWFCVPSFKQANTAMVRVWGGRIENSICVGATTLRRKWLSRFVPQGLGSGEQWNSKPTVAPTLTDIIQRNQRLYSGVSREKAGD